MHFDGSSWSALLAAAVLFLRIAAPMPTADGNIEDINQNRRRSKDSTTKDPKEAEREAALALSREIFRNITKQLRESLLAKGVAIEDPEEKHKEDEDSENDLQHYQPKHHHEHHWGPYFEPEEFSPGSKISFKAVEHRGALQITAHLASEALLNCRVGMLKDKTVMWLRRRTEAVQLLTVGSGTYAGDSRISVKFQYPNNWRLSISPVSRDDAGLYMCQVSTHPPRALLMNLTVLAPILKIVDEQGHEVRDRYYKAGSSLELTCRVSRSFTGALSSAVSKTASGVRIKSIKKRQASELLANITEVENSTRSVIEGGSTSSADDRISTSQTSLTSSTTAMLAKEKSTSSNIYGVVWKKDGGSLDDRVSSTNMSSTFYVEQVSLKDSGTYACTIVNTTTVSVQVHILSGEIHAAVQHDTNNKEDNRHDKLQFIIIVNIVSLCSFCIQNILI